MVFVAIPLEEKLWPKIDVPENPNECWNWLGGKNNTGYGMFRVGKGKRVAHRVVYELMRGEVQEGLQLDHLCRNRACVNPAHLEPVTASENVRRGDLPKINSGKTHCPHGHAYDEENTRWKKNHTSRDCRACDRIRHRKAA